MKPSRFSSRRVWVAAFVALSLGCAVYLVFALHFLSLHFQSSQRSYLVKGAATWSVADTSDWIKSQGFYAEANLFADAKIDGSTLLGLSEWDVGEVVGVKDPAARDTIYRNILRLRSPNPELAIATTSAPVAGAWFPQPVFPKPVLVKNDSPPLAGAWFPQPVFPNPVLVKNDSPPPDVIKFFSTGSSFLENPVFQIAIADLDSKCKTLDDVKLWLGKEAKEPIESFKGREGFDVKDFAMLKSLGKVYFLRQGEFYFLPVEVVGGSMDIFIPSLKREIKIEMLSTTPRLLLAKNFISKEECDKIVETAKPRLSASTVAVVKGDQQASDLNNQVRTSSTAWLNTQQTGLQLLDDITRRVYELVQVPMNHAEDMQVLHYGYKQHYHAHHDFFDPSVYPTPEYKQGHNRMITVFMYLSDVEEGGETNFPYATGEKTVGSYATCDKGLKVRPKLGDCIIFYSMKAEAQRPEGNQLDFNSLHAGCDVLKGDKWSANYWIRNVPWRQ